MNSTHFLTENIGADVLDLSGGGFWREEKGGKGERRRERGGREGVEG